MIAYAIVVSPIAPIFEAPASWATLADEALHGTIIEVLQKQEEFCHIRTSYGYQGYIRAADLNFAVDDPHVRVYKQVRPHRIAANFADVVDGHHVRAGVVATLPRGAEILTAGGAIDDYVHVTMADGLTHYMRANALAAPILAETEANLRAELIKSAKQYLGVQYRWGGRTPLGIDCSGLAFMAYALNGITIWRDSAVKDGFAMAKIPYSAAKPGDLVYFPGHVAMLLDDGGIIHSCHKNNGVAIESLNPAAANFRRDLLDSILHAGTVF